MPTCTTSKASGAGATWLPDLPHPRAVRIHTATEGDRSMEFKGYGRPDGRVGTRNYVGILSTVACANDVADGIARLVQGTTAFTHQQGCGQMPTDLRRGNQNPTGPGRHTN